MIRTLLLLATLLVSMSSFATEVRDSVLTVTGPLTEGEFRERDDFHTVRLSPGVKAIPDYAFTYCGNLREVELPPSVTAIGRGAFAWCHKLRNIVLPSPLKDLGSQAFAYCMSLSDVTIPESVTHIGANCFSFCSSLREIALPAAVKELESYAFSDCSSLRRATLPANSALLGEMIFAGCRSLESITEGSLTAPPFDCGSQPFDPDETELFQRVVLRVPAQAVDDYRNAPGWRLFDHIDPIN